MSNTPDATQQSLATQPNRQPTALEMIQSAIDNGALEKANGIEVIERLAKLQREMQDYADKVAFNEALHEQQAKMRPISADATNPQTKSKYASYTQLYNALQPLYSEAGFSLSFNTTDCPIPEHIRVLCDVSRGGHTRAYQIDIPCDGKGAKGGDVMTKTHATGAATSYGMRYLLKMIFNVAVGEDDSDGNAASAATNASAATKKTSGTVPEPKLVEWKTWIQDAPTVAECVKHFQNAYREAQDIGDHAAMEELIEAKNKRKAQLQQEPSK